MSAESHLRQWAESRYSQNYLGVADLMITDRKRSLEILKSFYQHFLASNGPNTMLDLGCGDGIITHALLQIDQTLTSTLIDGSEDMIRQARERLAAFEQCSFITVTFQELLTGKIELPSFDLVASSFAIHHLSSVERMTLFKYLLDHLNAGAYFINIDMVRSSSEPVEEWHLELWKESVSEQAPSPEIRKVFEEMLARYTDEEHYKKIDSLEKQMTGLETVGFRDVDCFLKYGIFAMYGGRKPD